ncbi:hypothetical protein F5I97DRAFT_1881593 [Phlebopus sp. FC_14]|nr:hypothetical protein F5I97DRAFT_1881593 [Phlebopus sp. FC_14]
MPSNERSLIGSVVERKTPSKPNAPSSRFSGAPGTGFPAVQHRSKSAFARAREEAKGNGSARLNDVPSVIPVQPPRPPPDGETKPIPTDTRALWRQISEENERRVASMTDEEIEKEKQEIFDQLGSGTADLLRRIREAKERKAAQETSDGAADMAEREKEDSNKTSEPAIAQPKPSVFAVRPGVLRVKSLDSLGQSASMPSLAARSSTRPSSRSERKLRFAEVTPDDVHVYESFPVSPKRTVLALPAPTDSADDSIVSLGKLVPGNVPLKRSRLADSPTDEKLRGLSRTSEPEPEEGTPEYIRRRYFPDVPANDPSLAWMEPPTTESDNNVLRFDLNGVPIPLALSATLPSHLGLHHHAGSRAGYTLDDIFLLSRSSVPAQRASMLGVLGKIARRLGRQARQDQFPDKIVEFAGKEGDMRKRILAAGLAAVNERGSPGAMAVEVVWECLVEWDSTTGDLEGSELLAAPEIISSLQLDFFFPQIAEIFAQAALPTESLAQLLAVVQRLAQESNDIAETIVTTPRLVPTILHTFLLTPIPPSEESPLPDPLALQLLITLASASRSNASSLLQAADALLRYITLLPPSSAFQTSLSTSLLIGTLHFYRTLACYGLYSHIATSASQYFSVLGSYVLSPSHADKTASTPLRVAWAALVESWIVCATDPHATTPPHEILWSQVCAWGWAADLRMLRDGLGSGKAEWEVWVAVWSVDAAWLEGSRTNGVKGGESERLEALSVHAAGFDAGLEKVVVGGALDALRRCLDGLPTTGEGLEGNLRMIALPANVLSSALRLFLACSPPTSDAQLPSPPFALPFSELSALCAQLVTHRLWSIPVIPRSCLRVYLRPLTSLLSYFYRLSRLNPATTPDLWLAQGLAIISRLLPGDESSAFAISDSMSNIVPILVPKYQAAASQPHLSPDITIEILRPFFKHSIRPNTDVSVGPLHPSSESISQSTTLRTPLTKSDKHDEKSKITLPLPRDWLTDPLTHLLRSGTSPVFRTLPTTWDASETEVVRATLLLLYTARRVLQEHNLASFVLGPAETVFACMRVCMLEHGVGSESGGVDSSQEVYRDEIVGMLMGWLLEPFTPRSTSSAASTSPVDSSSLQPSAQVLPPTPQTSLELASQSYLETTHTPFYQFYTDFVALYTAVSFVHPLFGALIIPPLAMQYAGDYRRLVWCESEDGTGSSLRTIDIDVEGVICSGIGWAGWDGRTNATDVREYLYPIEKDGRILGAYAQALIAGGSGRSALKGFLKLVAVHHVACTIWPDLQGSDDRMDGRDVSLGPLPAPPSSSSTAAAVSSDVGSNLLRCLFSQGVSPVVQDVLLYRQSSRGAFVWPPTCYAGGGADGVVGGSDGGRGKSLTGWRTERVEVVRRVVGDGVVEQVRGVFEQNIGAVGSSRVS